MTPIVVCVGCTWLINEMGMMDSPKIRFNASDDRQHPKAWPTWHSIGFYLDRYPVMVTGQDPVD